MIVEKCFTNVTLSLFFWMFFSIEVSAQSLPELITSIKPSIVGVGTYQSTRRPPSRLLGTGFVIGDGYTVVTNQHVVDLSLNLDKNETFAISVGSGHKTKVVKAKLVKRSAEHDLAILKIEQYLPPLTLSSLELTREGTGIAFTGFPIGEVLGLYPVTHRGIISSITPIAIPAPASSMLSAEKIKRLRNPMLVYQLDATAYPGNSGSPVFDIETGEVIGIINMVHVKSTKEDILQKPSGVTYAIPVKFLHQLLRQK